MKTVIITGVSRGIGLATAQRFLKEGWRVIGTYNENHIPLDASNLVPVELDLASTESISHAAEEIKKVASQIEVLVNNAGIILDALNLGVDLGKVRKTFEVDLFGVIDFTERLLPAMAASSHIINVDSQYGSFSFPIDEDSSASYRLAKAALNMYTRILAFRLRDHGITVSSLDPGWVKTDMGKAGATETEGPDREPEEAANDIYVLATSKVESGCFWRFGKKQEW